jgi:hypothetical protein
VIRYLGFKIVGVEIIIYMRQYELIESVSPGFERRGPGSAFRDCQGEDLAVLRERNVPGFGEGFVDFGSIYAISEVICAGEDDDPVKPALVTWRRGSFMLAKDARL